MNILSPGTRIGQYEIASLPMKGGMGVVYFALDHVNDGRPIALKTFRPELLPNREARDRFLREGTAWIELGSHPHIVRCYKVEYIDPTAFLVLELIAKEQNMPDASLRSWLIPGQPLPLEQALLFALQIARGMQHATEKIPGFVHRDLKPENILVGADRLPGTHINRLRITDFGLVKTIDNGDTSVITGNKEEIKPTQLQFTRGAGTPLYMAPEQWKGETLGVFTDVYAFGCILAEMLTGKHAANGVSMSELQSIHCEGVILEIPDKIPDELDLLIRKCISKDGVNRYSNWISVSEGLTRILYSIDGSNEISDFSEFNNSDVDPVTDGWSFNSIGISHLDLGNPQQAKIYFERALNLGERYGSRRLSAFSCANLGTALAAQGSFNEEIKRYEKSLSIDHEIGDQSGEASDAVSLGQCYLGLGEPQRAILYCERALEISKNNRDTRVMRVALGILGNAHTSMGNSKQAINFYIQALEVARQARDKRGEASDLGSLGSAYFEIGEIDKAIDANNVALKLFREIGDRRGEGDALGNLGIIYGSLKKSSEASELLHQAIRIHRETGNRTSEAVAWGNLGNIFREIGQIEEAFNCYDQRLIIDREIGNTRGIASGAFNIAALLSNLRENEDRAQQLAHEAAELFKQTGNTELAARAQALADSIRESRNKVLSPKEMFNAAMIAFFRANSLEEMGKAVNKYPIMASSEFIAGQQEIMKSIRSEDQPDFEKRINWLKTIRQSDKSAPKNSVQDAFEAFQRVKSPHEMVSVVKQYPFMLDKQFIQAVEVIIKEQVPPENRPYFEQRLATLRQLAAQK